VLAEIIQYQNHGINDEYKNLPGIATDNPSNLVFSESSKTALARRLTGENRL